MFLAELPSVHIWKRTTQGQEKELLKALGLKITEAHTKLRVIHVPSSQSGRTL